MQKIEDLPTCPKCGKIIDHIINIYEEVHEGIIGIYGGDYYDKHLSCTIKRDEYLCPCCRQVLFTTTREAYDFLRKLLETLPECYGEYKTKKSCLKCPISTQCRETKIRKLKLIEKIE